MRDITATWVFLKRFASIPNGKIESFVDCLELRRIGTGEFFTRIGDAHDIIGFVVEGLFRIYYLDPNGDFHIRDFPHEGYAIGSYATILNSEPAHPPRGLERHKN